MKPNATFNMNKQDKRILATLTGNARAAYKKAAIDAQMSMEDHKKRSAKSKQRDSEE